MEDFYKILCEKINADDADFDIELNRDHDIFKGHFPGEPITPGVCIVKTALELANIAFKNKYQIKTAKNIKFLNIISPVDNPVVSFKIHREACADNRCVLTAVTYHADTVFAKIKMEVF